MNYCQSVGANYLDEKLNHHRLFDEKDEEIFGGKIFEEFKKTSLGDWYEESEGEEIDTDNLR